MTFTKFKEKLRTYYLDNNIDIVLPSDEFLFWLVGFTEGDGSFIVNKRNELSFVLVQGAANKVLLERIYSNLPFGSIIKQGPRVYRLVVHKLVQIELLLYLFNGNIVLPSRKKQFSLFVKAFNAKSKVVGVQYSNNSNWPTLDNTWLLGFVEAEGCFTVSLLSNSVAFRTRFLVSQKGDINLPILSRCIELFGAGFIEGHHIKDNYSYVVSGLKNINKIYPYFDKNLVYFLGVKAQSYLKFKALNLLLSQQKHLDLNLRPALVTMAEDINSAYRKFK